MATFKSSLTPATKKPVAKAVEGSTGAKLAGAEITCIIAYPNLVEKDPQSDKFAALMLVTDPESQQTLRDLVEQSCMETFRSPELPPGAHDPLRDPNERNPAGELAFKHPAFRVDDGLVIRAKTGYQPTCVWGPSETVIDASEINGGDECVVQVSTYGYNNQSKGVAFSLGRIWLINKGDQKIERGTGASANVRKIDRSRLRFTEKAALEA